MRCGGRIMIQRLTDAGLGWITSAVSFCLFNRIYG